MGVKPEDRLQKGHQEIAGVLRELGSNPAPLRTFPIFLDKLDTYRRRYKSSAAGAIHDALVSAFSTDFYIANVQSHASG
jgi:hypothetical protein